MITKHSLLLGILAVLLISLLAFTEPATILLDEEHDVPRDFSRSYFPEDFTFGVSTSAYQVEGEANKKGRGPSVWDIFARESSERIKDQSNGDVAVDFYNRYAEDIQLMKDIGLNAFRFSISWSRIIPSGRVRDGVNEEGIEFYNKLINETKSKGLESFVTIFHWDTPQALEDKYGGFLSRCIVDDFRDFADLCFQKFGDRVKHWMTLNEPWAVTGFGYDLGIHAPGRCSSWVNIECSGGNSATEPYIVAHHLLLSHAAAVQVYREKYQAEQKGEIGITLFTFWFEPFSNSIADREAAKTALDFMFGLFMHPMTYGHYPRSVQTLVGNKLQKFTCRESQLLKGSYDFVGLQYYTSYYAKENANVNPYYIRYTTDHRVTETPYGEDGKLIGPQAYSPWFYIYPKGVDEYNNETLSWQEGTLDDHRIQYYKTHLWNVLGSIKEYNVNVKGYFAWSFMDNYEWNIGYTSRFGLYYVDYKDNMKRHPKNSASWFASFLDSRREWILPISSNVTKISSRASKYI
ncbi:beta-glucosidase 12 isoform X2 [Hevea brasiliensis]|uniref:beta-glucosidase 12 isoform X2 n=1 Tax=Hevea brasiliensis TaxID=3981 RepID=UPI0025E1FB21|nr:beta-glucosidase 12 isoform X2 [Hevea brasiliensis]